MKNKVLLLLPLILLTGCSSLWCKPKVVYETKIVKVIVPTKPVAPPNFAQPDLPLYKLDKKSTPQQVASFYFATILVLQEEIKKRDNALNAYRDFTPSNTTQSERTKK